MKVVLCDESHCEIFLNHFYNKCFHIEEKDRLEEYFKNIFRKLHADYHLEINGYYDIDVYQDKYYGMVLDIQKEDIDYYEFSMNEVDMRIQIEKDSIFLYEIEDCFVLDEGIMKKGMLYEYRGHYYFVWTKTPTENEIAYLFEHSHFLFRDTRMILDYAKPILLPSKK